MFKYNQLSEEAKKNAVTLVREKEQIDTTQLDINLKCLMEKFDEDLDNEGIYGTVYLEDNGYGYAKVTVEKVSASANAPLFENNLPIALYDEFSSIEDYLDYFEIALWYEANDAITFTFDNDGDIEHAMDYFNKYGSKDNKHTEFILEFKLDGELSKETEEEFFAVFDAEVETLFENVKKIINPLLKERMQNMNDSVDNALTYVESEACIKDEIEDKGSYLDEKYSFDELGNILKIEV